MTRYAIIDVANMFYRARHVVQGDAFTKAGMALAIMFKSLRKAHRDMKADHMVFCVEGRSWRYDDYPQYKSSRKLARAAMNEREKEEDEVFNHALDDFIKYIDEKTRCTVLQSQGVEGDDFVARWVQLHPNDEHVIISGDSDFVQLLAPNVSIYNGVDDRLFKTDGVYDGLGNAMVFNVKSDSGKIRVTGTIEECKKKHDKEQREKEKKHISAEKDRQKLWDTSEKARKLDDPSYAIRPFVAVPFDYEEFEFTPEPEWWRKALFVKLIRGDTGDGIFSAFPGVRYNGSAKKVGITEAWEDRNGQGFNWNNFMLQSWEKLISVDADGNKVTKKVRVIDEFTINEGLIDLTKQPDRIKDLMDTVIVQAVQKEPVGNVGIHFLKFCHKHDLPSISRDADYHAAYLNAGYSK